MEEDVDVTGRIAKAFAVTIRAANKSVRSIIMAIPSTSRPPTMRGSWGGEDVICLPTRGGPDDLHRTPHNPGPEGSEPSWTAYAPCSIIGNFFVQEGGPMSLPWSLP